MFHPQAPVEGLWAHSVLFRNNTVTDVCQLDRKNVAPVTSFVVAPVKSRRPVSASHTDLRVEGNTFSSGPGPVLRLTDIAGVAVTDNDVTLCGSDGSELLNASNTAAVRVWGNRVQRQNMTRICVK